MRTREVESKPLPDVESHASQWLAPEGHVQAGLG